MKQPPLPRLKWKSPCRIPPRLGHLLALTLGSMARRGPEHCLTSEGEPTVLTPDRVFIVSAVVALLHHQLGPDAYAGRACILAALNAVPAADVEEWITGHLDEIELFERRVAELVGFYVMDA